MTVTNKYENMGGRNFRPKPQPPVKGVVGTAPTIDRLEKENLDLLRMIMMILLAVGGTVTISKDAQENIERADRRIRERVDPADGALIIELDAGCDGSCR